MEKELDKKLWATDDFLEYEGASSLPDDCLLVVRNAELRKFEKFVIDACSAEGASSSTIIQPSEKRLNHDLQLQERANEMATELNTSRKRAPTKEKVAKLLAQELGMDAMTVMRRIRKQW